MYYNRPWSLAVQCVERIRTCHTKSTMNTTYILVLSDMSQFNAATTGLRLLHQVSIDTPVFTKPSPLGKSHTDVKVPWPINYWVIDKDTHVNTNSCEECGSIIKCR